MICEKLLICYGYLHILLFFLVISSSGCSRYILSSQYLTSHQKEGFKDMFVVFGIILDYWLLDLVQAIHMSWVLLHSQLLCNKLLYMQVHIYRLIYFPPLVDVYVKYEVKPTTSMTKFKLLYFINARI
ncbi:uncharacterized protein LOC111913576 isoform X4 [Lactuca sativa]|uniref:uncharacterized protein LOC111913576 isoform X4 n=1 Tax=Lactuca sativa TaxID=4236 RepID=UPI0022AF223B|nr:uncharacterized protein LOC111913576 isoform X4 [Lactuca sativa]